MTRQRTWPRYHQTAQSTEGQAGEAGDHEEQVPADPDQGPREAQVWPAHGDRGHGRHKVIIIRHSMINETPKPKVRREFPTMFSLFVICCFDRLCYIQYKIKYKTKQLEQNNLFENK